MARTTNQPSTATRPNTATAQLDTNGPDARSTSRTSGARTVRSARTPNAARTCPPCGTSGTTNPTTPARTTTSAGTSTAVDREFGENRERAHAVRRGRRAGFTLSSRPCSPQAWTPLRPCSRPGQQVFKSWSELAETMVKVQQDVFASMIGAANTTAKDITDIKVGDRRNGELAFSGSRTTASTPDRIEHDRR